MRYLFILLFTVTCHTVRAQLSIGGHSVFYDQLSGTFLACVPESCFDTDATLATSLQKGWQQCTIDGQAMADSHLFRNLTAEGKYAVSITDNEGQTVSGQLMFTFLPTVRLQGTFGNDFITANVDINDPSLDYTISQQAQVKWRGGTTNANYKHKRNYKLKFNNDLTLFGLRSDNNWILDAGQADVFRMRNRLATDVWNEVVRPPYYGPQEPDAKAGAGGRMTEVFVNNEYVGIYNFTECMDRKQMKLKKIDKKSGQIRGCLYQAKGWGYSIMWDSLKVRYDNSKDTWDVFEVAYPDLEDNDTTDWKPLYDAINFVVTSTDEEFAEHIDQYFDLPRLVDFCVFGSTVNALDNAGKNIFWGVYDKTEDSRLTLALWDMDCTFGQRWGGSLKEEATLPTYLRDMSFNLTHRLMRSPYLQFNDLLNRRYQELRQGVLSTNKLTNRVKDLFRQVAFSGAAHREEQRWSGDSDVRGENINLAAETIYICNWIEEHTQLLDESPFPLYQYSAISDVTVVSPAPQGVYTLGGQKLTDTSHLRPGIYIRNGKKVVLAP